MIGHYEDQYKRMLRSFEKITGVNHPQDPNYRDDVIHFFQDCYHLKDWIKNDEIIKVKYKKLPEKVEKFVLSSEIMGIVADIANASKHLELDDNKMRKPKTGDKNIDFSVPVYGQYGNVPVVGEGLLIRWNHRSSYVGEIASRAINEWKGFLDENKLNELFSKYNTELAKSRPAITAGELIGKLHDK